MKRKKLVAFALGLTLVTVTACSGGSEPEGSNTGESGNNPEAKPITISLGIMGGPKTPNSWTEKQLEERLTEKLTRPVDVKPVFYPDWDQATTKINLLMSDNKQRPNVVWTQDTKEFPKWVQAGLVQDLTPALQQNGKEIINYYSKDTLFYSWDSSGKLYRIPGDVSEAGTMTTLIRKDWLDALNLEVPTTLDEYIEVLRKFTNDDPDGNGKKDTYGFSGDNFYRSLTPFFYSYGVDPDAFMRMEDGSIKFGATLPEVKTVLGILRDLYKEGIMDPRMTTNANSNNQKMDEIFASGKVGSLYRFVSYLNPSYNATLAFKKLNPDGEYMAIEPVKGPDGFGAEMPDPQTGWCYLIVTNSGDVNDAVKVLNEMASPDTFKLINFGIEGEHYKLENGQFVPLVTPEEGNKLGLQNFDWYIKRKDAANLKNTPEVINWYETTAKNAAPMKDKIFYPKSLDRPAWNKYSADVKKMREEIFWGIITGSKPLDDFDKFVAAYPKLGGKEIDEEVNQLFVQQKEEYKAYETWYAENIEPFKN